MLRWFFCDRHCVIHLIHLKVFVLAIQKLVSLRIVTSLRGSERFRAQLILIVTCGRPRKELASDKPSVLIQIQFLVFRRLNIVDHRVADVCLLYAFGD